MSLKNITAFRIVDFNELSATFLDELRVRLHPFLPIDDLPEEQGHGWTSYADPMDAQFTDCPAQLGNYLVFALRVDKRNVPGAVLKKHYGQLLKQEEEQNRQTGKKFVSRERKKELRELAKMRLMRKAEPVPAHYPVIINCETGIIFFGCTSASIISRFAELFATTFQPLEAVQIDAANLCGGMDYLDAGRKFLTRVFKEGCLGNGGSLYFNHKVTIVDGESELSGCNPLAEEMSEIMAGLDAGKEVVKMSMCFDNATGTQWRFTCNQDLQVSCLRLPTTEKSDAEDQDGRILEEIYLIETLCSRLFAACKEVAGAN